MAKSTQYSTDGGTTWQQWGLTTADITTEGVTSTVFTSIKDKNDTLWVVCQNNSAGNTKLIIIKVDKNGTKNVCRSLSSSPNSRALTNCITAISRDNNTLFYSAYDESQSALYTIDLSTIAEGFTPTRVFALGSYSTNPKFAIYQDRYIWVASGSTVKIYDYETKAELASVNSYQNYPIYAVACSTDGRTMLGYIEGNTYGDGYIDSFIYEGGELTEVRCGTIIGNNLYVKQLLIDKWGDLIILTNSGTASTLLKYTSAGVQVGTTPLTLQAPMYNLNVDKDGAIFYSNDLGTYKINKNSAGQQQLVLGTPIRATGMTTYGNRMFLDQAVFK